MKRSLLIMWISLLSSCGQCLPAYAHSGAITECDRNLSVQSVEKIGESTLPNGLLVEGYDRNHDEKVDIETLSNITEYKKDGETVTVEHSARPIFWIVDLDFDEKPDQVFIDKNGEGRCEDIVLYRDLQTEWRGEAQQEPYEYRRHL